MTLALFLALLALTAFFNLAEMALIAARASRLEEAADKVAARRVIELKARPGLFLAAIRAGDLVTDLLIGAYVVTWLEDLLRNALGYWSAISRFATALSGIGAFVIISFVALVFADLAPKSIALSAPERAAMLVAAPVRMFILIARPIFALLEAANAFVLKLIGVGVGSEDRVTQEEIRRTLAEGLSAGALLSFERTMLERVLDLDRRSVRTVMTGRRFVQGVNVDASAEELRRVALESAASRLLVTRSGEIDEVVGTVSRGDLLAALVTGSEINLAALVMPIAYVSENASALSVLEILKLGDGNIVVVVDEFGSLVGIATMADVLEAIAGDVATGASAPGVRSDGPLMPEPDGCYLVEGTQPIDDIAELLPISLAADRVYKTVAGFVIDKLRHLPVEGESLELLHLRIEVIRVDAGTISLLRFAPENDG